MIPWRSLTTAQKREAVRPLAAEGLTYRQMAARLAPLYGALRVTQVQGACRLAGLLRPRRDDVDAGAGAQASGDSWRALPPQTKKRLLEPLAEQGLTAAQIADALTAQWGAVTRFAVIGACRRLGVVLMQPRGATPGATSGTTSGTTSGEAGGAGAAADAGACPQQPGPRPVRRSTLNELMTAARVTLAPSHAERAGMPADERRALALASCREAGPIRLQSLTAETCRWPLTADDGSTVYCGAERAHGAFCTGHGSIAYCPSPADKARLARAQRQAARRKGARVEVEHD
ncbi:GcrA family cell cycle regulator [Pannonibacter tanglangensis]|uniref:GcrA cell cycle regulator n=1 Tax=Pannonibacter tanglangensis TaxID=2750084 RepID=A0ABW9ZIB0_9HYPH|nr:GcrA family cell cycle regulator [Pannonibacter sp. XCT-34]NBN64164.1 hypothetical protein [Pannonibacter sp. XCT-34]